MKSDERALIAHLIAVVWSAKYSDAFTVVINSVALFLHLMRTNEQLKLVVAQEVRRVIWSKAKSNSSLGGGFTR